MGETQNVSSDPFSGEPGTSDSAGGTWGNSGGAPKPHSRQDVKIVRRVLMGEWAKNDSRLTALKALSNLEQQFQRLEEQLEAARAGDEKYGEVAMTWRERALKAEEQLRSREDALREVYELIYLGEPDNALHGLDAYMIREGIFRGEAASSPAKERQ